jgi:hypothetical protein
MKKYFYITIAVIISFNIIFFSAGIVRAQDNETADQTQTDSQTQLTNIGTNMPYSSGCCGGNYLGTRYTVRGTQTCPRTVSSLQTVCEEIMVPQTNYVSEQFTANTCSSCTVQGTKTYPTTVMVPKTVCRLVTVPKTVNVTTPFFSSGFSNSY